MKNSVRSIRFKTLPIRQNSMLMQKIFTQKPQFHFRNGSDGPLMKTVMFVQLPWHPQSDSSMNPECPVRILCGGRSRHDSYVRHTYKTVMECRRKYFAAWRQKKNEWTRFTENGREKKTYPSKASFKYNKAPSITPQQIQLSSNNSIQLQSSQVYVNVMILTDSHGHSRSALLNVPSIRTTDRVGFFFIRSPLAFDR